MLRSFSGDKRVTGVYPAHFVQALCALGCDVEYVQVLPAERVRVRQWLESNTRLFENQHVVIDFSSHFGTLLGVASRTIIWPLVKQIRVLLVPLFHGLHWRLALER